MSGNRSVCIAELFLHLGADTANAAIVQNLSLLDDGDACSVRGYAARLLGPAEAMQGFLPQPGDPPVSCIVRLRLAACEPGWRGVIWLVGIGLQIDVQDVSCAEAVQFTIDNTTVDQILQKLQGG